MSLFDLIVLLAVAAVCGALGQTISGYSRGGCLTAIAVGFVGALLGAWLSRSLDLPELFTLEAGTFRFPIVWSIIGSTLFVAVVSFIRREPVERR